MRSKPTMPSGRPPRYVKGRSGKPIIGLSLSSQRRYYATHSKPRRTFGRDFDQALMWFRRWQAEHGSEASVPIPIDVPAPGDRVRLPRNFLDNLPKLEEFLPSPAEFAKCKEKYKPGDLISSRTYTMMDPAKLYDWARAEILANPVRFAERVGIPQIAYLDDLPLPGKSPTLASILKTYTTKADVKRHERQRAERYWKEFRKFIGGKTIRDTTQEQVADYHDWVMNEYRSGRSRAWVAHRFGKIKALFNFAATRGIAPAEIAKLLALCKILKPPRKESADPHPISREDFQALLDAADAKWKAILLCMLNCALYAKEVGDLLKKEVDLEKRTLVTDRSKTGMVRIAVLWHRTIRAIKAAPDHAQHPYLFQNAAGTKYHPDHIRRGFDRLRTAAGVSDEVKVSDIRDGAYTAAIEGGADGNHAMLLAGHATGMKDAYVRRNPKMVADACAAIERAYFGEQQTASASV